MEKITNIEEIRTDLKIHQVKIMSLSGLTELEYGELQFEIGMKVLEANLVYPQDVTAVASNKLYWNYFRLQWLQYDEIALRFISNRPDINAKEEYKRRMNELIHSRRMWLSLRQFFTMFKII